MTGNPDSLQAYRLVQQGRLDQAEALARQTLTKAPADVESMLVLGLVELRRGRFSQALEVMQGAAKLQPSHPLAHHYIGRVHDAAGNPSEAVLAHARALALDGASHVVRLHYAAALERSGDIERAVLHYQRALHDAQTQGRWLNSSTTPVPLQPLVQHAARTVRDFRKRAFESLLQALRARYGAEELQRVEQALRFYTQEEQPSYPDPRQRPTFFYVPGLPHAPYLDRALFPWIEAVEARTGEIRREFQALEPQERSRERVFTSDELERQNLKGEGSTPSWNGYYLYRYGERRRETCERCPVTSRTLEGVPLSHVREHAPEVLFSVFTAGTHLLPHRGVTNTRLVAHLPLIVPEQCALRVADEIHEWREGRIVVFDDTYEHEAWNRSGQTRVVLIFDVWNPHLSEAERAAVSDLIAAMGDFRKAVEAL